jgi:two-component system, response regulator
LLLVEDNPHDLELAIRSLRKHGLSEGVVTLRDGVEAQAFLFSEGPYAGQPMPIPRVILLDLKLPKVAGSEVLRRLKSDPRTRRIPVVILSSSQQESDLEECCRLGANSYLVKPVDYDQYQHLLGEVARYWIRLNEAP